MLGASSMLWMSTLTLTTLSSDEPAAARSCLRLARIWRVSLAVVPRMAVPDCRSVAVRPDTNRKSPPLTIADAAAPTPRLASVGWMAAATTSRFADMDPPNSALRSGDHVELNLEPGLDLRGPDLAGGRAVRHVLAIDAVENVVLDAVVDQRMHLHEAIERGAGGLQQQFQIAENEMGLAGERAVAALAGFRVDRQHAGAEDQPAGADRRRLMMAVMLAQIEPAQRRRNDFAHYT